MISAQIQADGDTKTLSLPAGSTVQQALEKADIVLEYLDRVENNRSVPKAKQDDERLKLLDWDREPPDDENVMSQDLRQNIDGFLKKQNQRPTHRPDS